MRSDRDDPYWHGLPDDLPASAWEDLEYDTPEEVEAVFRAQRRLSLRYGAIFLAVTVAMPLAHAYSRFWTDVPVVGGFTLAQLAVLFLYPAFCIVIGLAYAMEASRLEESLLGRRFARYYEHPAMPAYDRPFPEPAPRRRRSSRTG